MCVKRSLTPGQRRGLVGYARDAYQVTERRVCRVLCASRGLDTWAYCKHVRLDFSRPGKPTDNAYIESFNARLRAECLNAHVFESLEDAEEPLTS